MEWRTGTGALDATAAASGYRLRRVGQLTIRGRLIVIALASSVPLGLFSAFLAYRFIDREYGVLQQSVAERVRLLSVAVDLAVSDVQGNLRTLAASPLIRDGEWRRFYDFTSEVNRLSGGVATVLVDRAGQQIVNTFRPFGAPLPQRSDLRTQTRVFATGAPATSGIIQGALSGRTIVSIEVPVMIDGEVRYVLAMGLTPDRFTKILREQQLPTDWRIGVADRQGLLITRLPDPESSIGRPAGGLLGRQDEAAPVTWAKSTTADNVEVYASYWRSELTGWTTAIGVPQAGFNAPHWRAMLAVLATAAVVVVLSILAAIYAARLITRPLAHLERAAHAVGSGVPIPTAASGVREIDMVRDALAHASGLRARAEEALLAERSLLRGVLEKLPIAVNVAEVPSGRFLFANDVMKGLWNASYTGIDELRLSISGKRFHADGRPYAPEEFPLYRTVKTGAVIMDEEIDYETGTGERRTMVVNCAPVPDQDGRVIAAVAAIYDITERKHALDRQRLLLDEINHRAKNAMATVQSIARLSARSAASLEEYVSAFQARLVALSEAYDLLGRYRWQGAHLRDVVAATLGPHLEGERITAIGPSVYLRPRTALALTSALHELATNSLKYGALSAAGGRVALAWSLVEHEEVELEWKESGGPPVKAPSRRGFGTRFLEQALAAELEGQVALVFRPAGLVCTIRFRLTQRAASA